MAGAAGPARVALGDDAHVEEQKARLCRAPGHAAAAVEAFGLASTTPTPGSTSGRPRVRTPGRPSTRWPTRGILAAPGNFYGPAGREHVRIALTATDERIAAAVRASREAVSSIHAPPWWR